MYDVLCFGELLIDFTSKGLSNQGNVLFEKNPGGAPANVSVCMSKLGKKSAFMGMVGNDIFGEYLKNYLESMGVDVKSLKKTGKSKTTLAFVEIDKRGERSFNFYRNPGADTLFTKNDIDYKLIDNSKIFHFGSLSMTDNPSKDTLFYILKYSKKKGLLISYDPNYRHLLWNNRDEAKRNICEGLKYTDILKISEEELKLITSSNDLEKGSEILFNKGIGLVLITLGNKGAFYRYKGGYNLIKGFKVKPIDTTGAGDAFMGGMLYNLCGIDRNKLSLIDKSKMDYMVKFANAVGALTVTGYGAMPAMPILKQVKKIINK